MTNNHLSENVKAFLKHAPINVNLADLISSCWFFSDNIRTDDAKIEVINESAFGIIPFDKNVEFPSENTVYKFDYPAHFEGWEYFKYITQSLSINKIKNGSIEEKKTERILTALIHLERRIHGYLVKMSLEKRLTDFFVAIKATWPSDYGIATSQNTTRIHYVVEMNKHQLTATEYNYGWDIEITLECLVGIYTFAYYDMDERQIKRMHEEKWNA